MQGRCRNILAFAALTLACLGAFALPAVAFAENISTEKPLPPKILRHSQTSVTIFRGDRVELEVLMDGASAGNPRWLKSETLVCESLKCPFDSTNWGYGTHHISFVVTGEGGIRSIRFQIKLIPPPALYHPVLVPLSLVEPTLDAESVAADDVTVEAIRDKGFMYGKGKAMVVGPELKLVNGDETFRTQAESVLRVAKAGMEEHVVLPRSEVKLAVSDSGLRIFTVNKGALRSRMIGKGKPRWRVRVGTWVEFEADEQSDILVDVKDPKMARLIVVRGLAQVKWHVNDPKVDPSELVRRVVVAGSSLRVTPKGAVGLPAANLPANQEKNSGEIQAGFVDLEVPHVVRAEKLIQTSTPHWSGGAKKESCKGRVEEKVQIALERFSGKDFAGALELFSCAHEDAKTNYEVCMALGRSLSEVWLYGAARAWLDVCEGIDDGQGQASYTRGSMALLAKDWEVAADHLSDASGHDDVDQGQVMYRRGVAAYKLGRTIRARSHFSRAEWEILDPDTEWSTAAFLDSLEAERVLRMSLDLSGFSDDNILRVNSEAEPGDFIPFEISERSGYGYRGRFAARLYLARMPSGEISTGIDFGSESYKDGVETGLAPLAVTTNTVDLDFKVLFGQPGGSVRQNMLIQNALENKSKAKAKEKTASTDEDDEDKGDDEDEKESENESEAGEGDVELKPAWVGARMHPSFEMISIGDGRALDTLVSDLSLMSPRLYGLYLSHIYRRSVDPLPGRIDVLDPTLWQVVDSVDRSNIQSWVKLGMNPDLGPWNELDVSIASGTISWASPFTAAESIAAMKFSAGYALTLEKRWQLPFHISYEMRNFPQDTTSRRDSILNLGLGAGWRMTPEVLPYFRFEYENHASTVDTYKYSRTTGQAGVRVGF